MDLRELGWGSVDRIGLAQDRDKWREGSCEFGDKLWGFIKCWETIECLHNWWPLE
jgi:hypothetical protein